MDAGNLRLWQLQPNLNYVFYFHAFPLLTSAMATCCKIHVSDTVCSNHSRTSVSSHQPPWFSIPETRVRRTNTHTHTHARVHPHPDTVTHAQKLACTHSSINYEYFSARKLLMLNTELCETFETLHYICSSASFFLSLYLPICTFHVLSSGFASTIAFGMSLHPFSLSFSFVFETDSSAAEWLHFNTNFRSSKKLRKWFELLYD